MGRDKCCIIKLGCVVVTFEPHTCIIERFGALETIAFIRIITKHREFQIGRIRATSMINTRHQRHNVHASHRTGSEVLVFSE